MNASQCPEHPGRRFFCHGYQLQRLYVRDRPGADFWKDIRFKTPQGVVSMACIPVAFPLGEPSLADRCERVLRCHAPHELDGLALRHGVDAFVFLPPGRVTQLSRLGQADVRIESKGHQLLFAVDQIFPSPALAASGRDE